MDLRQLQAFLQVASAGSVRAAAARIRIAQSAVSRQVQALEHELGVVLFDRHARGVTLTAAGERLRDRAAAILRDVEAARAEIMAGGDLPAGTAAIGTSAATSRLLYARLAERFRLEYPAVTLDLVEGAPYILHEGLDTRRLDLAILVNPEPRPSLSLEPLVTEQVFLVGAPGDRSMPKRRMAVAELAGFPLILFPRPSGSRMDYERAAAAAGISLRLAYEVESQDVLKEFVARRLGYGLLPYSSMRREADEGRIQAVEVDGLRLTRTLVRRTDQTPPPAVEALARTVREEIAALDAAGTFGATGGGTDRADRGF